MFFIETRIKLMMLVVSVSCLALTTGIHIFASRQGHKNAMLISRDNIVATLFFGVWVFIPYRFFFDTDEFEGEVRNWAASSRVPCNEDLRCTSCPSFDRDFWNHYARRNFLFVVFSILSTYSIYKKLFANVRRSLVSLCELRRHSHFSNMENEEEIIEAEKPVRTEAKRVTFVLPEPEYVGIEASVSFCQRKLFQALPSIRQVILAMSCLAFGTILLPQTFQHAFSYQLFRLGDVVISSDHVIASLLLFVGIESARCVSMGPNPSFRSCGVRVAASQFTQFYGIFLLILSVLAMTQANDLLRIYIYKVLAPCSSSNKWRSYYDVRVSNESALSKILGDYVMKYTSMHLNEDSTFEEANEIIETVIEMFMGGLGDCVTVLLFATLVFVPNALAFICSR